jgi:hypothetical protein
VTFACAFVLPGRTLQVNWTAGSVFRFSLLSWAWEGGLQLLLLSCSHGAWRQVTGWTRCLEGHTAQLPFHRAAFWNQERERKWSLVSTRLARMQLKEGQPGWGKGHVRSKKQAAGILTRSWARQNISCFSTCLWRVLLPAHQTLPLIPPVCSDISTWSVPYS